MVGEVAFLIFVLSIQSASAKQRTVVQGQLYCDGKEYSGATVKLYDKDLILDDLMAKNESKKDGSFYLDGTASDLITNISPKLYIYHKCNKGKLSCKREWIFVIPGDYVFKDTDKKIKVLDVGRWELMLQPKSETTKCLPARKANLGKQRVIAIGQVLCNGKPYDGAIVKLYDKEVLVDTLMARNQTLKDGSFYLDGTANDILSKIDPELYIYHKCNKGSLSCKREWIFTIPKDYVYDEKDKKIRPIDVGRWDLVITPKSETYKCLPAVKKMKA